MIGERYVVFAYPTVGAAARAWEEAERKTRFITIYRYARSVDTLDSQMVMAMGEDDEVCRPQLALAEEILSGGATGKVEPPVEEVEVIRSRRVAHARKLLASGEETRAIRRFGAGGAFATADGKVRLRRRAG